VRHGPVVGAVAAGEGVVPEHPPATLTAFRGPLDDQQVLLERVAQDHDVPDPDPVPVPHDEEIAVIQRGHHRRPGHGDPSEELRDPCALALVFAPVFALL